MIKNNQSVVKWLKISEPKKYLGMFAIGMVMSFASIGCSAAEQADSAKVADSKEAAAPMTPVATQATDMKAPSVVERSVVRNGSLNVRVPDAEKSEKEVTKFASSNGGFVSKTESSNLSSPSPTISMTVRIPVKLFDTSIETFEKLGTRLEKKVSGEDVTTKIVDFDARLKTMLAQEDSFRNMLKTSGRSTEALDLQTRLMKLREEIESMQGQRKALADMAALSTIELTLVGETKAAAATEDKGWFSESWNSATTSFGGLVRSLGTLVIFALVYSPVWGIVAGVIWWLIRKGRSRAKLI